MSPEDQRPRDPPSADGAPVLTSAVLEYAGPTTGRAGRKVLPAGAASVILGAEVALGSIVVAEHNASPVLALPLGLLAGSAIYFILTVVRKGRRGALVVGQLVLALTVTMVVVFITLHRGAAGNTGAKGTPILADLQPRLRGQPALGHAIPLARGRRRGVVRRRCRIHRMDD